jgi:hypothetical protein
MAQAQTETAAQAQTQQPLTGTTAAGKNFKVHLGAARARHAAGMGGALHSTARTEAFRPPRRSVRAGGYHVQHLLRLADRARLHHIRRTIDHRQITGAFVATFKDFPPLQRPAYFTIDQAMEKLKQSVGD